MQVMGEIVQKLQRLEDDATRRKLVKSECANTHVLSQSDVTETACAA